MQKKSITPQLILLLLGFACSAILFYLNAFLPLIPYYLLFCLIIVILVFFYCPWFIIYSRAREENLAAIIKAYKVVTWILVCFYVLLFIADIYARQLYYFSITDSGLFHNLQTIYETKSSLFYSVSVRYGLLTDLKIILFSTPHLLIACLFMLSTRIKDVRKTT